MAPNISVASDTVAELIELVDSTSTVEIAGGPMADPDDPHPTSLVHEVSLPPIAEIRSHESTVDGVPALVVEVVLDVPKQDYLDRLALDSEPWPQYSYAEIIHSLFREVGITVPTETRDLGVQIGEPWGSPEDDEIQRAADILGLAPAELRNRTGHGGVDESRVVVQGYIPLSDAGGQGVETDGGLTNAVVVSTGLGLGEFLAALASLGAVGMARQLVDIGEEYTAKNSIGTTFDVGVYNDSTDSVADTDDLAALTTEPSDGNYARQSEAFTVSDISGNWGTDTDTDTVFDMTSTTGTVDSWFTEINFNSTDAGTTADHLLCTGALSQSYDLSNLTQLTISAAGVGWTLD